MERMWGSWEGGSSSFLEKREQNVATSQEKAWGLYCYNSLGICVEWRQWYICGHREKCCFAGVPLMCWATCPRWCSFLMKRWGYVQSLGISNLAECFRCWLMLPLNGPACCNWNAQAPVNRGWKFINEFWPSEHGPWKSFWQGTVPTESGNTSRVEFCYFIVGIYDMKTCRNFMTQKAPSSASFLCQTGQEGWCLM